MSFEIRNLRKQDADRAIDFAITGMHFDWYTDSRLSQRMYGRYFWYKELCAATQLIAAYQGDTLAGVLVARINGRKQIYGSVWKRLYVSGVDLMQRVSMRGGSNLYEETNRLLYREYEKAYKPDGEIVFLAANPVLTGQGVGSFLLNELERRERGKQVYLYTDDSCTYQFYDHKGFRCVQERKIQFILGKKTVQLRCMLYAKTL